MIAIPEVIVRPLGDVLTVETRRRSRASHGDLLTSCHMSQGLRLGAYDIQRTSRIADIYSIRADHELAPSGCG